MYIFYFLRDTSEQKAAAVAAAWWGHRGMMKTLKNHQTAKRAPKIRFYRVDYTNTI